MSEKELIPQLYRTEFRKLASVLCRSFGLEYMELAEDIVSETFLLAAETWGINGLPDNPVAWLYAVAKNRAKDQLKRNAIFQNKIIPSLQQNDDREPEVDLSQQNIADSQLQMMFAIDRKSVV